MAVSDTFFVLINFGYQEVRNRLPDAVYVLESLRFRLYSAVDTRRSTTTRARPSRDLLLLILDLVFHHPEWIFFEMNTSYLRHMIGERGHYGGPEVALGRSRRDGA